MLPVVNRKSMPQNILVKLLEVMTQFPETRGGRFLRVGERFVVDKGMFEEGMPFGWRAGFLETLIEEFGNRLIVDWTRSEGLLAQNSRQVIEAIDTNSSRGCRQCSQPFIHFVSCFDSVKREVRSEVMFLVAGWVGFGVGGGWAGRVNLNCLKLNGPITYVKRQILNCSLHKTRRPYRRNISAPKLSLNSQTPISQHDSKK